MSSIVLDASALLALIGGEPGSDIVAEVLDSAALSSVNASEVFGKLSELGLDESEIDGVMDALPIFVVPFEVRHARRAGLLRRETRTLGLSIGDRACLALALDLDLPVLTADRVWAKLDLGIEVRLIR